jgi:hypothetical protein
MPAHRNALGFEAEMSDSAGLHIELERPNSNADGAGWSYAGHVTRGDARVVVSATVATDGAVDVTCEDATLRERVRLLLRACYKQSVSEGLAAPPRKIVRWREERV